MAVVATGFFDGVHLGHRQIIKALLQEAASRREKSVVVTFSQHPQTVLKSGTQAPAPLTSRSEKISILKGMGVDEVSVLPFTREFASMTAREYLRDILVARLGASCVILGYDSRLGSDTLCPEDLVSLCAALGLDSRVVPPYCVDSKIVSSSLIRALMSSGNTSEAARLLGDRNDDILHSI